MEAISKYMPMTRVGMKKVISNCLRKFIYIPAESLLFHAVPRRVTTVLDFRAFFKYVLPI
jgi:hypothetical protein